MHRDDAVSTYLVSLLATGDEIINGDILNSNAQEIAARLFNNGMQIGMHMVAGDRIAEIEAAIHFLLKSHRALIITGGLGPTSDDLTRYALAAALNKELVFDEQSWHSISDRLKNLGYDKPPETNRQQALFPEGATIIPNPNGTAAGCLIQQNEQIIIMLPGPPLECLPMLEKYALPALQNQGFQKVLYHRKWLLFGVSEGQIAEELDALAKPYQCITGYRLWYPYIEFKIYSNNQDDFNTLTPLIEKTLAPYVIEDGKYSASELLRRTLITSNLSLYINDVATGGLLESTLRTPDTEAYLHFSQHSNATANDLKIEVKGLDEFWQGQSSLKTTIEITFSHHTTQKQIKKEIPLRGMRVKSYAMEYACRKMYQFISEMTLAN